MDNFTKKHLQDILNAIDDIETFFEGQPKLFEEFCRDIRLQRAIERCIEIIGEAMNRILKENKDIAITNARKIVDARIRGVKRNAINRVVRKNDNDFDN